MKKYDNAQLNKDLIFKDNENKSFVYRWINKINGKEYIGSTSKGRRRLLTYFDDNSLRSSKMPIYNAILKYTRKNFIFEIIEYCQPAEAIQREQYYLDRYDFEYNILEKANSLLGYKHTEETITKMKGRTNALGYKHTPETLDKLREYQINKKHSLNNIEKMRNKWAERKLNKTQDLPITTTTNLLESNKKIKGKLVVVTNIHNNVSTEYISITEAALALNITRTTLRNYIKNKVIFNLLKQDSSGNNIIKENYLITIKEN